MSARDTTPDAAAAQTAIYRRMGAVQRCEIASRMSAMARSITLAGIHHRHPEYNEQQARWALFRMLVGDALFVRVWPRAPLLAP